MPYLLRTPPPDGRFGAALREVMTGWDFEQGRDSPGAAYYNAVFRHLLKRLFDDELPEGARASGGDRWFEVVRALLDRPDDPYWDDVRTTDGRETREDILAAASRDAQQELRERLGDDPAAWRWGDLHTLTLTHQTLGSSGIAPVEWLFNRDRLRVDGGRDAVNATGWDAADGYEVNWVPSLRMIVDLADLDRSRWINLTGASGHAFHANYTDQTARWADGRTIPMRHTEPAVRAEAAHTLTLTPG
jgi:penicillin amidase